MKNATVEDKVVAKQSGPTYRVKSSPRRAAAVLCGVFALSFALGGCANDGWYRSDKTQGETNADYKACNDRAQDAVLTRAGRDRATYSAPPPVAQPANPLPTGQPGLNLGETPMQMHDRVVTEKSFDNLLAECMSDKGYTQGKPAPGK